MSSEMKDKLLASLMCLVSSSAINALGWTWIAAFVKLEEMRIPYIFLLSVLLAVVFHVFASIRKTGHVIAALMMGLLAGVLCGTVAITTSNLAIDDGVDRLLRSFQRDWLRAAVSDVPVSLLLGSWFVGSVSFGISWKYLVRVRRARGRKFHSPEI